MIPNSVLEWDMCELAFRTLQVAILCLGSTFLTRMHGKYGQLSNHFLPSKDHGLRYQISYLLHPSCILIKALVVARSFPPVFQTWAVVLPP